MIKRTLTFIYEVLVEMGEQRHARLKRSGQSMWY